MSSTILHNAMAANPTLRVTMVKGGKSATATPTKKNDPPQRTDNVIDMVHSKTLMEVLMDDVIVITTLTSDYFRLNLASSVIQNHLVLAL